MGSSNGLGNVAATPVISDFYDQAAVLNKKRQEGIYFGIRNFFGRTMYILQLIAFWLVHELTGFVADAPEQTPLAQWGIIIHAVLIPFIAVLLGTLIFVKLYDLYPKKMKEIHAQLKELKL